ncbi:MAG: CAP domain-containing protein [Candidatus Limnocylindrales bacterium]
MTRALAHAVAYASVVALLLALLSVDPATAGSVTRAPAVEKYAHSLLNCTRTGGFVTKSGTCLGRGSGKYSAKRPPLRLHKNISLKVAWPWARTMSVYDVCDHAIAGKPKLAQRMRSKGFRYWYYGENVGCGWDTGDARAVVLAVHRLMQAEKKVKGGHWRNIKDRGFKSVGVGVARGDGHVMVVWDFYGKRY